MTIHQRKSDTFPNPPIVIAIELAQADRVVVEIQLHEALWQLVELSGPRGVAGGGQFVSG